MQLTETIKQKFNLFASRDKEIQSLKRDNAKLTELLKKTPSADPNKELQTERDNILKELNKLKQSHNDIEALRKEYETKMANNDQSVVDEAIRLVCAQGVNVPHIETIYTHNKSDIDTTSRSAGEITVKTI